MNPTQSPQELHSVLTRLSTLPQKMLSLYDHHVLTELVLHELCSPQCFNFARAAYLIDNPDFDCCRGVAGFDATEYRGDIDQGWQNPDQTAATLRATNFNKKIRDLSYASVKKNNSDYVLKELSKQLGTPEANVRLWPIKHGNYGILLFEHAHHPEMNSDESLHYLDKGLCLLGFCPIF